MNFTEDDLDCPTFSEEDENTIEFFSFWVEGVANVVMAALGLVANTVSSLILCKEDMRNSFNFLLIALFFMDSCYLVGSITEAIRKSFNAATSLHLYMFPYFLYPCLSIAMTCSVFMTVAVALERYIAVHYPIDYSQAINSPEACRRRLFKYVIPVVIMAVFVNAPKFFESTVGEHAILTHPNTSMLQIGNGSVPIQVSDADITYIKRIEVTDLRKDPTYTIYYNNWTRLMLIGIVPFILLIYFNYKIYQDVKHRNRRQMSMSRHSATATQQARRRQEDNLAIVFMGIVLVFLICHSPRLILSMHEMMIIHDAMKCQAQRLHPFHAWTLITMCVSHLLLVINSSINMILYIFLNESFRRHFVGMVRSVGGLAHCFMRNPEEDIRIRHLGNGHETASNNGIEKDNGHTEIIFQEATA
ncbi:FMRFamide peptide receptor frpr-18-like [Tigriopus californicus]|uniref:FMRFamide peptide receptor frpr-18-like n=1 Tax=Tigriopus californicus TaxID=6832 RepID=UPI0027DA1972|nr:FMRFamide peptide receptor frpr-18-like [Tigriopus californicus]